MSFSFDCCSHSVFGVDVSSTVNQLLGTFTVSGPHGDVEGCAEELRCRKREGGGKHRRGARTREESGGKDKMR